MIKLDENLDELIEYENSGREFDKERMLGSHKNSIDSNVPVSRFGAKKMGIRQNRISRMDEEEDSIQMDKPDKKSLRSKSANKSHGSSSVHNSFHEDMGALDDPKLMLQKSDSRISETDFKKKKSSRNSSPQSSSSKHSKLKGLLNSGGKIKNQQPTEDYLDMLDSDFEHDQEKQ